MYFTNWRKEPKVHFVTKPTTCFKCTKYGEIEKSLDLFKLLNKQIRFKIVNYIEVSYK